MNLESIQNIDLKTIMAAIVIGVLGCFFISSDQHLPFCALIAGGIVLLAIGGGVQSQLADFSSNEEGEHCHIPYPYGFYSFICIWDLRKQAI